MAGTRHYKSWPPATQVSKTQSPDWRCLASPCSWLWRWPHVTLITCHGTSDPHHGRHADSWHQAGTPGRPHWHGIRPSDGVRPGGWGQCEERLSQLDAFYIHYWQGCECRLCLQGSRGSGLPESIWRGLLLDIRQEDQSFSEWFRQMGKWSDSGG